MFQVNNDLSIYATRGDVVLLRVTAADANGTPYTFKPGEIVRFTIFAKKDASTVYLKKDFHITSETETVDVLLLEDDLKIGEVISKPLDCWYEVELNPHFCPQTIIGYDEDGPKIFKLFPEGLHI